jgi:CheY-like chemotaxis protein
MKKPWSFLIADDDPDDRDLFASILRELSADVTIQSVSDGTEVMAYLDTCPERYLPDVLILDYNMPRMSAPQVLDSICGKPKYYGMAKFILSTSADKQYIDGCLKKGAIEYFQKPPRVAALRAIAVKIIQYLNAISKNR